jgi:hypothetical protein
VTRFLAGFALASLVWGGLGAYLVIEQGYGPAPDDGTASVTLVEDESAVADETETERTRRPRRPRRSGSAGGATTGGGVRSPSGDAVTGDDLGEDEMRTIDGAGTGGEEQLTGAEIDHTFDGVMPRVRRCFILAASDREITGTLTFGLRIGGDGHVAAANLSGPAVLTTGECGDCLRTTARSMQFPTFDGPEMVVRYPITLE